MANGNVMAIKVQQKHPWQPLTLSLRASQYGSIMLFRWQIQCSAPWQPKRYKSSRMAEWSALHWAGRPPGQSWGTPAASTCRSGHRQCRQFHRFLREFEICLATREIFFTFFHHIIVSKNVVYSLSQHFWDTQNKTILFIFCFKPLYNLIKTSWTDSTLCISIN